MAIHATALIKPPNRAPATAPERFMNFPSIRMDVWARRSRGAVEHMAQRRRAVDLDRLSLSVGASKIGSRNCTRPTRANRPALSPPFFVCQDPDIARSKSVLGPPQTPPAQGA